MELYSLAKPRSQKRDRTANEIEYEKNCDQCTFHPDLVSIKATVNKTRKNSKK